MDAPEETWKENWAERILVRLQELGFDSVAAFLAGFPSEPYVDVVKRIAPWVVAMQLSRLQMQEAKHEKRLRKAAMDSLARDLNWRLPNGWELANDTESRAAGAFANTIASVVVD